MRILVEGLPPTPLVIFAAFVTHVFTFGPLYAFGVFLPDLRDHFDLSIDAAAAVHSVMATMQFVGGVLAGMLMPHFCTHRTVALASSLWVTAGFAWASFAHEISEMYIAMAPIGLGLGMFNLAALTALNMRIKEGRALAVGLATSGTSIGTICLPPFYSATIESFGWRWALRLSGGSTGIALAISAFAFQLPASPAPTGQRDWRPSAKLLPCADARYLFWWLNMVVCFLGYFSPSTLLAQFARDELHLHSADAAVMYTAIGVGALSTRVSLGCITAKCGGARRVHAVAQVCNGILAVLMPFCWDRTSLLVWSVVYGFSVGPVIALISVILAELFGVQKLPFYHGVSRLGVGIGTFAGPPLIGALAEQHGYRLALLVAGMLVCAASPFLAIVATLHARALMEEQGKIGEGIPAASPSGLQERIGRAEADGEGAAEHEAESDAGSHAVQQQKPHEST